MCLGVRLIKTYKQRPFRRREAAYRRDRLRATSCLMTVKEKKFDNHWPLGWSNPTPTGFLLSMPHLNTRKRLSALTLIAKQEAMLIIIRHSKDKEGHLWTFFLEIPHC